MTQSASRTINDCFDEGARQPLLSHAKCIELMRAHAQPIVGTERISLSDAVGRALATAVVSDAAIPGHRNAAVDGFAFNGAYPGRVSESPDSQSHDLTLVGEAAAGHPFSGVVGAGEAVRIFTGAVVPDACDRIAMQEGCTVSDAGDGVRVPESLKAGANIRPAGEDVSAGAVLYEAGHVIRAQDLAALASIGAGTVTCFHRPRVAIIATGDEIIAPGAGPLGPGQVYDANSAMLAQLLRSAGADVSRMVRCPDDRDETRRLFAEAAADADILVTSGGASQGREDHVAAVVGELGSRHYWRINVKPGRPMLFGQIGNATLIGLPGNPVAAFVCMVMYGWPLVRALGGATWPVPERYRLPAGFAVAGRKRGRREYWRAWTERSADGTAVAMKFPRDGSGLISGLRLATGLIEVAEDDGDVADGDMVTFIPLTRFIHG